MSCPMTIARGAGHRWRRRRRRARRAARPTGRGRRRVRRTPSRACDRSATAHLGCWRNGRQRHRGSMRAGGTPTRPDPGGRSADPRYCSGERRTRRWPRRATSSGSTSRRPGRAGPLLRAGRLAYGVGQGFEVVAAGPRRAGVVGEPDDLPAARRGEPLGVLGAQVVAVRFGVGGERAEDGGGVRVDVRQRRDGGTAARGARTATYKAHDVGRYRTLERAATTLRPPHPVVSCRGGRQVRAPWSAP